MLWPKQIKDFKFRLRSDKAIDKDFSKFSIEMRKGRLKLYGHLLKR